MKIGRLLAAVLAAVILTAGCSSKPTQSVSPSAKVACGSWLELDGSGAGYVTISVVDPHITCGTHPTKSVAVDPPATAVFFFDSDKKHFLVAAPPGAYTVTYTEDCPPISSVCATINVRVP